MHLNELKALHVSEVLKQAEELEIENTGRMRKQELMFAIIKKGPVQENKFSLMACLKFCLMDLVFYEAQTPVTRQAQMIFTSVQAKSGASTCTLAT